MNSLTFRQAQDFGADIAAAYGASVISFGDSSVTVARTLLTAIAKVIPVPDASKVIEAVFEHLDHVSCTIPTVGGSWIFLSNAAMTSPVTYAATLAHEAKHARDIRTDGARQTAVDYLLSAEMRATREADAYAVGIFVEHLLTGAAPTSDEARESLSSSTYLLGDDDVAFAVEKIEGHIQTMVGGVVPPIGTAQRALNWLRTNAPEAILAPSFKVA